MTAASPARRAATSLRSRSRSPAPASTPTPTPAPLRLGLLLYPGCMPAGLFATADMARAANLRVQRTAIQTVWVGSDLQAVPTWQGPALAPTQTLAGADVDAVLVPGLWLSSADGLEAPLQHLAGVVRALAALDRKSVV